MSDKVDYELMAHNWGVTWENLSEEHRLHFWMYHPDVAIELMLGRQTEACRKLVESNNRIVDEFIDECRRFNELEKSR